MNREQAVAFLRDFAPAYPQRAAFSTLPANEQQAANWAPPGWVVDALLKATEGFVSPTLESKPTQIVFGFFQAEQLLGQFGGDTDAKMTVSVEADGRMLAWVGDYPEEGHVELRDEA